MSQRVFLHVGLPKTGTTFIQAICVANKETLAAAGLLFPGEEWADQVRAVRDVRQFKHRKRRHREQVPGAWDRLTEEILAWDGDALISMEWLSRAPAEQVRRILDSFGTREVHVLFTVRDLARVIPASWQESMLNQNDWTWPEFLAEISEERPGVPMQERRFWKLHDIVSLLANWTPFVPADRIHVITVPRPGSAPDVLWGRVAGILGLGDLPVQLENVANNRGLGATSTELMRRLTVRGREAGMGPEIHDRMFAQELAKAGLSRRAHLESRPTIPPDLHAWVEERASGAVAGIRDSGVEVVGSLEELWPDLAGHTGELLEPADSELLSVALDGLVAMAELWYAEREAALEEQDQVQAELTRLERRVGRLERRRDVLTARLARWETRPVRAALRRSAARVARGRRTR